MQGKTFFTILGLLIAQSILSLIVSFHTEYYLVELVISAWFLFVAIIFLKLAFRHSLHAYAAAVFAFIIGMAHVVYLWFFLITPWMVVMLALSCAGFVFTISYAASYTMRKPVSTKLSRISETPVRTSKQRVAQKKSYRRKKVLDKELPKRTSPEVVVYTRKIPRTQTSRTPAKTGKKPKATLVKESTQKSPRKKASKKVARPRGRPPKKR